MKLTRYQEYHENKEERLKKLYDIIGYPLRNQDISLCAITCSNFAKEYNECKQDVIYEHDGLAVVGDAVLKAVISIHFFSPELTEGYLTDRKKELESNASLQEIAYKLKIDEILFSSNTDLQGKKKMATAVEAIIGALYFSHGFEACQTFIKDKLLAGLL